MAPRINYPKEDALDIGQFDLGNGFIRVRPVRVGPIRLRPESYGLLQFGPKPGDPPPRRLGEGGKPSSRPAMFQQKAG